MKPNDSTQGEGVQGLQHTSAQPGTHDATTNVIRSQIDSLYGDNPVASPAPTPQSSHTPTNEPSPLQQQQQTPNTYERTHANHAQPQAEQWKAYHSAWQDYYQKYYAGYYAAQQQAVQPEPQQPSVFGSAIAKEEVVEQEISKDEALFELRQKLLGKVRQQAKKVRGSKHFMPIAAALIVVLIFSFVQYNRFFIGAVHAYVSPGAINPQNIIIDPTGDATVGPESKLIIPKINVDVPVIYDTTPKHEDQMAAMDKGVAHFAIPGANSKPGEIGNTVLAGHSSNDLFDQGDYKFIFIQLERLTIGDKIYANYQGKRYTYVVTKTETVKPNEVNKLIYPTDKPMMTLITCTPIGTATNRFLVTAEQVSPDPKAAAPAPTGSGSESNAANAAMPGNSPTMLERLFGSR